MANVSQIKLPNNTTYDIDAKTVNGKTVESNVPSNAVFTDTNDKVKQTNATDNEQYNVLFSSIASTTVEKTAETKKSAGFYFNPSTQKVTSTAGEILTDLQVGYSNSQNGHIKIYNATSSYNVTLDAYAKSSNKTITLPNKTGTVALTSDCIKYVQTTCTVDCSTKNLNNVYNGTKTITKPYSGTYIASICEVTSMSGWAQRADAQAQYDGNTTVYCSMISPTHGNSAVNITVTVFYI